MTDSAMRQRVLDNIRAVLPRVLNSASDGEERARAASEETRLMEDLGLTSTEALELLLELEKCLDIQIDVEPMEPSDLASLGSLADFVAGHAMLGLPPSTAWPPGSLRSRSPTVQHYNPLLQYIGTEIFLL
jgi:acyl carrier protein